MKCNLPPEGWYCTRSAPHDGPCAAIRWRLDRAGKPIKRSNFKLRLLLFLGSIGPVALVVADRIAHFFGICLGL